MMKLLKNSLTTEECLTTHPVEKSQGTMSNSGKTTTDGGGTFELEFDAGIDIHKDLDSASKSLSSSSAASIITDDLPDPPRADASDNVRFLKKRAKLLGIVILLAGFVASSIFAWVAYLHAKEEAMEDFQTRADELILVVENTWLEYQRVAASTHEICRRRGQTTRTEFREFYEYMLSGGIEFQAIQCAPNVTNEERPLYEKQAKVYWESHLDNYTYTGFSGLIWDSDLMSAVGVDKPSPQRDFYFPVHYVEPVEGNMASIDLDLYSDPVSGAALIDQAIQTQQPVVTGRLKTVEETEENAYSVVVYHPGVPLSTSPGKVPDTLSILLVRIPSLLERVARLQEEDLGVFIYDNRPDGSTEFLGAAMFNVNEQGVTEVKFPPEMTMETLKILCAGDHLHENVLTISSGSWTVIVAAVNGLYDPEIALVIFGCFMLFVASIGIAYWIYSVNMRRVEEVHRAKAQAESERKIVANLFPENVRERLLEAAEARDTKDLVNASLRNLRTPRRGTLTNHMTSEGLFGSKPIADFHPETTLMFADLRGFTAWSSVREPSQVFTLLEVLYHSFDRIAIKRKIYKVETVGDCYVAAAGLPNPMENHAEAIAMFALACLKAMPGLVSQLETTLGPDTGDLKIRIGLHSGAVTSGVLRGDKGRFQLFGDTINTASRMESTGLPGKIQVSPETADLLRTAGMGKRLEPREVKVFVKGKGHLQTYWLCRGGYSKALSVTSSVSSNDCDISLPDGDLLCSKTRRLVRWNIEEMTKLIKQVVAKRQRKQMSMRKLSLVRYSSARKLGDSSHFDIPLAEKRAVLTLFSDGEPLDEVKDVIELPERLEIAASIPLGAVKLDDIVDSELKDFVTRIASMYRDNYFHNFEHAGHVAMSVTKLLSRNLATGSSEEESHEKTFGIVSDPMMQFAAFFSALIHDLDHQGVPNGQLIKEKADVALKYNNKSVAEQNSVDLAWEVLMDVKYANLRQLIFSTKEELKHFRQLVVQMVMATDIMDKDLASLRRARWQQAFSESATEQDDSIATTRNRRATIVIEHLIQASDVSHTMQHWHIFIKWNENLFMEMYHAYKQGRLAKDPSDGWYEGEMGFFDFYVIPLSKKLATCGVFGKFSDEFLMYATENRKEWELKGQQIVQDYVAKYNEAN